MADLNERNNGLWGRERGDRANTELDLEITPVKFDYIIKSGGYVT